MAGCVERIQKLETAERLEGIRKIAGGGVGHSGKGPAVRKAVMPRHKMGHLMSDDDGQLVYVPLDGVQQACTLQRGASVGASSCSRKSIARIKVRWRCHMFASSCSQS